MIDQAIVFQSKKDFISGLQACMSLEDLEVVRAAQLGKSGLVTWWFKELATLDLEAKKALWPVVSDYKTFIDNQIDQATRRLKTDKINRELKRDVVDFSVHLPTERWYHNLIQKELMRMYHIFSKYGFAVHDGVEIATKYQNFYSVNIPATHPATQIHDTLYLNQKDENGENLVLRTHTSCMQQELISTYGPECRFVVPGRVYRAENMDATHDVAFWQLEWVAVGRDITLAHFKHDLKAMLSEIFEMDLEIRLRPGYFPFTEPSYEVDIDCRHDPKLFELSKRRGWLEILGCGMIHPNVLKEAGVDSESYSGYAFGMGITRMIAIKYGIKDIRLLTNGDLRFVKSFN